MDYWRVSPRIWYESGWDDDMRLLALYLLTCEHRTVEGLYRLPKAYIQADLGWTEERLAKPFAELLERGFIDYDDEAQCVLVANALKYQRPETPNQLQHALKQLDELPKTRLIAGLLSAAERFCERLVEPLRERLQEGFGKPTATATATATELTSTQHASHAEYSEAAAAESETHTQQSICPFCSWPETIRNDRMLWSLLEQVLGARGVGGVFNLAAKRGHAVTIRRAIEQVCGFCADNMASLTCEERWPACRACVLEFLQRCAGAERPVAYAQSIMRDGVELADYVGERLVELCRDRERRAPPAEIAARVAATLASGHPEVA